MKPLKVLLLSFLFLLMFNFFIYAASMIDVNEMIIPDDDNEILNYNLYLPSETLPPSQIKNLIEEMEEIEEEVCTYNIDLYNLNKYNLVSLENANIRCHVRGSIWIGGTLIGSQYIDDGSLNGESLSNSYIYENQSTIYFKSRTTQQSQDAYYKLAAQSVIDTTNYWKNILSILPKNSEYIKYVEPDANGYVDIRYWDYQCPGADTSISTIPILYWTDATKVDMGGLAGHLIAPFADIYITYCNHCGSIVGKTITTDGESHLNYWVPTIEPKTELITETEKSSSITIKKTLYCNVWHTECDVMGDEYWVKDEISNPEGIKSKEGHRKDHCGAIDSWYVYLDEHGKPYTMLEMKAGSTNNKIPLPAYFYTDETYTEVRDPATIKAGERIYWTTKHKGQVWHHTGVTRLDIPTFEFIVDGESYYLKPDESLEIKVSAGNHTIIEKYNKEYIINDVSVPFSVDKDENAIVTVNIVEGAQIEINFENRPKNMPEPPEPPETEPVTETESIIETEIETETELITETEVETESITETETEVETETELIIETESITESESETKVETETELIIETESEKITETITESESESERKKETEPSTEKQTEKIIEKSTEKQTETETNGEVLGISRNPKKVQPDEIYEPETNEKKKSKVNGISRKTESVGLFENLKPISIPKTGDTTPIKILVFIFSLSAIIIICIIFYKRYNKK